MKFYLTIEDEGGEVVFETVAPTEEMMLERLGAYQRATYMRHD